MTRRLVISAVNFTEGGPLTVLRDCVEAASRHLDPSWEIVALVNNEQVIKKNPRVKTLAFPLAKKSWFARLYYEWWYFAALSKTLKPDLWLSLHDITPRVTARRMAVYCHNPSPFYKVSLKEAFLEPTLWVFNKFYKYVYAFRIRRNHAVIVQQEWLRNEFIRRFSPPRTIVAYPATPGPAGAATNYRQQPYTFLYPTLPRVFKNLEVLCEAATLLNAWGTPPFQILLTVSGGENRYATELLEKYGGTPGLVFLGRQNRDEMQRHYEACDCVVFPSRLETWGLPISEAKAFGKPLLAANLPYAHETVGNYGFAAFFEPKDAQALARLMQGILQGRLPFAPVSHPLPSEPFAKNWDELLDFLVGGLA